MKKSIHQWILRFLEKPENVAVRYKKQGEWYPLTNIEYLKRIVFMAELLEKIKKSLGAGARQNNIALLSQTRWEWSAFDIAVVGNNDVLIPLYPNQSDEDFAYILENSRPAVLILENQKNLAQFKKIQKKISFAPQVIVIEDLTFKVQKMTNQRISRFIARAARVKPDDAVTIIYTSGTTGKPKGVVLQEKALVSEITDAFDLFDLFEKNGIQKNSLAFLPFAHVMGRIEHWGSCYAGYTLNFAESVDELKNNLREIKPDFLIAVPRIFEKIYATIISQVETRPLKKRLFDHTLEISKQVEHHRRTGQTMHLALILQYEMLSRLVFKPIKDVFGGNLKFAVCGGAPLSAEMSTLFSLMGVDILEGYGLTETFATLAINTAKARRIGSVGKPIGDVQIRFAEDGEILVKSEKCMLEYYKNPEATAEAFAPDGFFKTGDIGEMSTDGFLKITDRKKDLIKTSGGKYVAPQKIENLLKQNPNISQVLIIGDKQKYISAIINVEKKDADEALAENIKKFIQKINSSLPSYESIKKFEIVTDTWNIENGAMTPSLKIKRKVLEKKYARLISSMYN